MSNYTVYEIYDLTKAPTITKRKIAHEGSAAEVAREITKGLPLVVGYDGERATAFYIGTDTPAYIVSPEGLRQRRENAKNARKLCNAILEFGRKPDALENFERYLSYNFDKWLAKWASTPEGLAQEFESFARIIEQ